MSKYKKIEFDALRDNLGATGGPGGVLYIQQQLLGDELCGLPTSYRFNFIKTRNVKYSSLRRVLNMALYYVHFFFQRNIYYIAHDVETGSILALLHKKYSLIFHHQGSVVLERTELAGHVLSNRIIKYHQSVERRALSHAVSLHFPSNGAAEMYFNSDYATCCKEDVNLGMPLYNVILQSPVNEPEDFPLRPEHDTLTMFSLGTLTKAKGQDQTVEFLSELLPYYPKPIRYIMVGSGPLKDQLIQKLDNLNANYKNFTYHYFERLGHDEVMYVHKISDVYIMLHRVSIFDFATLEAMSQRSAVILSNVGGNPEYNRDNNILFAEDIVKDFDSFANCDIDSLKDKNLDVFDKYFSKEAFKAQYELLLSSVTK